MVEPMFQRRNFCEVTLELADRLNMREDYYYAVLKQVYSLTGPYKLDLARKYTWRKSFQEFRRKRKRGIVPAKISWRTPDLLALCLLLLRCPMPFCT